MLYHRKLRAYLRMACQRQLVGCCLNSLGKASGDQGQRLISEGDKYKISQQVKLRRAYLWEVYTRGGFIF